MSTALAHLPFPLRREPSLTHTRIHIHTHNHIHTSTQHTLTQKHTTHIHAQSHTHKHTTLTHTKAHNTHTHTITYTQAHNTHSHSHKSTQAHNAHSHKHTWKHTHQRNPNFPLRLFLLTSRLISVHVRTFIFMISTGVTLNAEWSWCSLGSSITLSALVRYSLSLKLTCVKYYFSKAVLVLCGLFIFDY